VADGKELAAGALVEASLAALMRLDAVSRLAVIRAAIGIGGCDGANGRGLVSLRRAIDRRVARSRR
jgi:hypothetical protein